MKLIYALLLFCFFSIFSFSQTIELTQFANNFNDPVEIAHTEDDRLFVVEKSGVIKILNNDGTVNATPFLNISASVGSGGERGLLGLAFDPDYATSGRFYVNYTDDSSTQTPNTIVARYTVSSNPNIANTTETILLTIPQPYNNHNGGKLAFGTDGFLYISTGDGGSGGDPGNRSQNTNTLLGKLLRLDVSSTTYTIPTTNPYATTGGLPEIYAIGLRNPWKMSFDKNNGDLWIADVGQSSYEEINKSVGSGTPGDNYGWRCFEGANNYNNESSCPPMSSTKIPVSEYNYGNGPNGFRCSITGGYVYRGSQYSNIIGKYLFADYCSGEIGLLTESGGNWTMSWQLPNINLSWVSFGEDNLGELYVVGGNAVYKISDSTLSVSDEELAAQFKIFPNPSNGEVTVNFGATFSNIETLSIKNSLGQQIKTFNNLASESFSFSTKDYSKGLYFIETLDINGSKTIKKLLIK
ncbi:PQQ-dependent sugar dehydrogenase [Lacinutrix sp. Bg11-31]|uniref:PQQ-dependent sugar dehydrogenase n=1 Tax=Lacinutrix sp. Bg11-31 TaxID=2057808 RepID=UPI000C319D0F|nr:PQQ-dependent sugar dehydrogenase [Lacinutrix sp. Bg11-31]AUC81935.1 hypothetical protein CW733_07250 [Lacinutrix sp. Bg11-31]